MMSKMDKNPIWPKYLLLAFQFVLPGSVILPWFPYKTEEEHKLAIQVIAESEDVVDGQNTMGFSFSIVLIFDNAVTNGY